MKGWSVHIALGVRADGSKEILGLWLEQNEGAKFWLRVMNELKNRGIEDVLIAIVDGLKGFPEAITAVFPQATVQTCIVHLLRHSLDFVSWKDRKLVAAALKEIFSLPQGFNGFDQLLHRARQAVKLPNDHRIAAARKFEGIMQSGPIRHRARQLLGENSPAARFGERVPLQGQILVYGRYAGIADQHRFRKDMASNGSGFTHEIALVSELARSQCSAVWKRLLPSASVKPYSCWTW